jgi:hypothetical protein
MITTVADLIALLEDFDPDSPIALATQPSYPLAYHIAGVNEKASECECDDLMEKAPDIIDHHHPDCPRRGSDTDEPPTVWLLQGEHTDRPYDVPTGIWEAS